MDKLFKVTVNGNSYDVRVEEVTSFENKTNEVITKPEVKPEVVANPQPQVKEEVKVVDFSAVIEVKAPMPGEIWKILKRPGDTVKKHETILILEVMKMENEIVAPQDGTIKNILVNESAKVAAGQVLVEMV